MSFADTAKLAKEGRNFDCSVCPKRIQKLRRCWEPREDFTAEDGGVFPIYIQQGGQDYGFCPSKVYRDQEAVSYFKKLALIAETNVFPEDGGLNNQEHEIVQDCAVFIPIYKTLKLAQQVSMFMGDGGSSNGNKQGRSSNRANGRLGRGSQRS